MSYPPTERLYYDDAYRCEFEARFERSIQLDDGRPAVLLEATYFYPTGGGQAHDLGELAGVPVVDVVEIGPAIAHVLERALEATEGQRLAARIDPLRRRAHRQQHSGQHILSRALEELLQLPTDSARLGEHSNTIDLKTEKLSEQDLERVYARANEIVWEARPVRAHLLAAEEADSAELRKKSERSGIVRVIEVEGFDRCPCGGTHVANSGEVGLIAPLKTESIARGVRLHFLCGQRALAHLRMRDGILGDLALRFTSGAGELRAKFEGLVQENKELGKQLAEAEAARMRDRARGWLHDAESRRDGERPLRLLRRELPAELSSRIQSATSLLRKEEGLLSVLALMGPEKAQLLVCRGPGCDVDCAQLLRELGQELGLRGGGNADQARGSLPAKAWPELDRRFSERFPEP